MNIIRNKWIMFNFNSLHKCKPCISSNNNSSNNNRFKWKDLMGSKKRNLNNNQLKFKLMMLSLNLRNSNAWAWEILWWIMLKMTVGCLMEMNKDKEEIKVCRITRIMKKEKIGILNYNKNSSSKVRMCNNNSKWDLE